MQGRTQLSPLPLPHKWQCKTLIRFYVFVCVYMSSCLHVSICLHVPFPSSPAQLHWLSEQQEVACLSPDLGMGMGLEGQGPAQMNRLQRLSLLHLTTLMDRYSPSCKQGWIW